MIQGNFNTSDNGDLASDHNHEDESESSDAHEGVEESDSSEDEVFYFSFSCLYFES